MRPPEEEVVRKLIGDWTHKADADIQSAETLLSHDPPLIYPSCFHSQQAAEKYLKAYLTWRQLEFPKTHSIRELLNLVELTDTKLAKTLLPAAALTPYAVEFRYPADIPEPTLAQAREALTLAQSVAKAILKILPIS
jgi:HEPN domain-containing protein